MVYGDIPNRYAVAVSLAKNIKRLRKSRDLTQGDVAKALGVKQGAVSKWEKGKSSPPVAKLPGLALLFVVRLDELFRDVEPRYDRATSGQPPLPPFTAETLEQADVMDMLALYLSKSPEAQAMAKQLLQLSPTVAPRSTSPLTAVHGSAAHPRATGTSPTHRRPAR